MSNAGFSSIVAMVFSATRRVPGGVEMIASGRRLAAHALSFGAVWAILTGGQGWAIGVPAVLLASAASSRAGDFAGGSIIGLLRFLPYFAWNSLQSGIDVARRALHPRLPIEPCLVRHAVGLEPPAARVFMANIVTLLPGTLSADLQGRVLVVHVLDARGPTAERLAVLERRVADLFGLEHAGAVS